MKNNKRYSIDDVYHAVELACDTTAKILIHSGQHSTADEMKVMEMYALKILEESGRWKILLPAEEIGNTMIVDDISCAIDNLRGFILSTMPGEITEYGNKTIQSFDMIISRLNMLSEALSKISDMENSERMRDVAYNALFPS